MSRRYDYVQAIDSLVKGSHPLTEAEKNLAVELAAVEHSRHRPLVVVEDVDGDGGFDYLLSELASWEDGFSIVKQVEYPVDDTLQAAKILEESDWTIYEKPGGKCLRFRSYVPSATEDFRVTYTSLHSVTTSASTIKNADDPAVKALCAAHFAEMLASYYAAAQDSTIAADSVDHKSKAAEYATRARALKKIYYAHLGIKEGEVKAASVTADQDAPASWQTDKLTHPSRLR